MRDYPLTIQLVTKTGTVLQSFERVLRVSKADGLPEGTTLTLSTEVEVGGHKHPVAFDLPADQEAEVVVGFQVEPVETTEAEFVKDAEGRTRQMLTARYRLPAVRPLDPEVS